MNGEAGDRTAPGDYMGAVIDAEMWRLWLEAWEDYGPQIELEQLSDEQVLVTSHEALVAAERGLA